MACIHVVPLLGQLHTKTSRSVTARPLSVAMGGEMGSSGKVDASTMAAMARGVLQEYLPPLVVTMVIRL